MALPEYFCVRCGESMRDNPNETFNRMHVKCWVEWRVEVRSR